jgi:hypothetical protein
MSKPSTFLWYLGTPITGKDSDLESRVIENRRMVASLWRAGIGVYSPILHWYSVVSAYRLESEWERWKTPSSLLLGRCDGLLVLQLPGWGLSTGLGYEISLSRQRGIPIEYAKADGYDWAPFIENLRARERLCLNPQ